MNTEPDWVKRRYSKNLTLGRSYLEEGDRDIHDYILRGLSNLERSELSYIFGVENPTEFLSEGDTMRDGIRVEDFAIKGSYGDGEIAIGQVASCNGKELVGALPRDYRQAINFGQVIDGTAGTESKVTGYYLVRSNLSPEEVRKHNNYLSRDVNFLGRGEIDIEILEIRPEESNIDDAIRGFYSSLTHS